MKSNGEIEVVYEDGVLKPEGELGFPEHSRLRITICGEEFDPRDAAWARQRLREISEAGLVSSNGLRLTRDQMHERR